MSDEPRSGESRPTRMKDGGRARRWRLPRWLRLFGGSDAEAPAERRTGPADRRQPAYWRTDEFATQRHTFYRWVFQLDPHCSYVDAEARPPIPATDFEDPQRKTEVLLSLHNSIRDAIQRWEDRIFQAFIFSAGGVVSAVVFFIENRGDLRAHSWIFGAAVFAFGLAVWLYLYLAARAHAKNGIVLSRLEAALGLCRPGTYIVGESFFGYSGFWVADWRTAILLLIHGLVVAFASLVIFFY